MLKQKLQIFIGGHNCNCVCRRCSSSYTSQNVLIKHKERCEQQKITSFRTSKEAQIYWSKHFHKNPSYLRNIANFEADIETDKSSIGKETFIIFK